MKLVRHYGTWDGDTVKGYTTTGAEYEINRAIIGYLPSGEAGYEFFGDSGALDKAPASLFIKVRVSYPWLARLRTWFVETFPNSALALKDKVAHLEQLVTDLDATNQELLSNPPADSSLTETVPRRDYESAMQLAEDLKIRLGEQIDGSKSKSKQIETLTAAVSIMEQTVGSLERRIAKMAKVATGKKRRVG